MPVPRIINSHVASYSLVYMCCKINSEYEYLFAQLLLRYYLDAGVNTCTLGQLVADHMQCNMTAKSTVIEKYFIQVVV